MPEIEEKNYCPYKNGTIIECISVGMNRAISVGTWYTVKGYDERTMQNFGGGITIRNDKDQEMAYRADRFVIVEEADA